MGHTDLLNFKDLHQYIQFRKAKTVNFSKARRIVLSSEHPWSMLIITSTGSERVNLNKRSNKDDMKNNSEFVGSHDLKKKYEENKQITIGASKVIHLKKLRPYLSFAGRRWVDMLEIAQRTAGPRPRADDQHTNAQPEPENYINRHRLTQPTSVS